MKFENKRIKDICQFIGGSQPPKTEFIHEEKEGYVRLIQIRDRLNDNFITYIPKDLAKRFCEPSDILIGRYGPPIFQVFRGFKGAYNVAIMKAEPINDVNKDYLYYFLLQDSVFEYVDSMSARTAGQTGVELDSLYEYPVMLPDKQGQEIIADTLKTLDAKIETNNKINAELEALAKTIYDYWFLQFDFPDENGKPYKSSGGKMVWCEELKREIPEGWRAIQLNECMNCNISSIGKYFDSEEIMYLDTSNITRNHIDTICKIKKSEGYPSRAKRIVQKNDILFSTVRPEQRHYGIIKEPIQSLIASTGFAILSSTFGDKYNDIFYLFITTETNINALNTIANSSVSSYPSINSDDILNLWIALPNEIERLDGIASIFDEVFQKIWKLQKENQQLTSLRDFLLPLLMNGQVGFEEANE